MDREREGLEVERRGLPARIAGAAEKARLARSLQPSRNAAALRDFGNLRQAMAPENRVRLGRAIVDRVDVDEATGTIEAHLVSPSGTGRAAGRPFASLSWAGKRLANVGVRLALAHHIQRLIDGGRIADRAEVARRLHWTRDRVCQVMDLWLVAPDVQEEVLLPEAGSPVTERSLRAVVRHEDWGEQRRVLASIRSGP